MVAVTASKPDPQDDAEIRGFLMLFCQHMAQGDLQNAVSMWATPAMIISEQNVSTLGSRKEIEGFFGSAKDHYNTEGASGTRPDVRSIRWATGGVAIVEVRWPHLDEERNELGAEMWTYVLRRTEARKWKFHVGVLHGAFTNWDSGAG